jgi:hypothetical protein
LRAPESGVVTRLDLTPGTVATPGNPLFALVVDKSQWVDANFKETELGGVRPGWAATTCSTCIPSTNSTGTCKALPAQPARPFCGVPAQNANGGEVQRYLDPLHLKAQGAGLALPAQQNALQAQMLGLLQAFWLIVGSFVVMVPLVMRLKPRKGEPPPDAVVVE